MAGEKKERVKRIQRERFVDELSCIFEQHFGECPDSVKLWEFSRAMFVLITELTLEDQVSLHGIGTFTIHKSAPRKNSAEGAVVIPSLRFKPSSRLGAIVNHHFGIAILSGEEGAEELPVKRGEERQGREDVGEKSAEVVAPCALKEGVEQKVGDHVEGDFSFLASVSGRKAPEPLIEGAKQECAQNQALDFDDLEPFAGETVGEVLSVAERMGGDPAVHKKVTVDDAFVF